ncbi:MAG: nucleoside deaminase, partial [Lachnospiraceae bacterium]
AIRKAGEVLGTHDLSGCVLYATGFPCPMCLSAIIWANIQKVYYGCTPKDAEAIGFRDDFIYRFIQNGLEESSLLDLEELDRAQCMELFEEYTQANKAIY